ncbi:HYLS1 protein, partial [Chaetops frenatus]|nr:HYLS1 protein [Chaetops frenatus]
DPHQSLRWAVRRQMLQQGPPCRVPKRPSPNTYVVPTMKKRNSLRWGVRWDMAHHLMPHRN